MISQADAIIGLVFFGVLGLVVGLYLGGVFELTVKFCKRKK